MKVVLLENIRKIGSIGDVINVKRGFARNYLISNNKALYASKENIKEVEKIKSELSKKDQQKKKKAKEVHEQIHNNELYGSVKPTEISKLIIELDKQEIKPSMIQLGEEIKSLGTFKVKVNLHSDIQAEIKIIVIAEENT